LSEDELRTLEQIEDHAWGAPPADATRLIKTVYALRHKPVGLMNAEDLRVLVLQQVSLDVLVPVALTHLARNPLAEGDFYPGDLLAAVLKVPATFWREHPGELHRVSGVIEAALGHHAPEKLIRQQISRGRRLT
jgi:hypothetical protein